MSPKAVPFIDNPLQYQLGIGCVLKRGVFLQELRCCICPVD